MRCGRWLIGGMIAATLALAPVGAAAAGNGPSDSSVREAIARYESWAASATREAYGKESLQRQLDLLRTFDLREVTIEQLGMLAPYIVAERSWLESGILAAGRFANDPGPGGAAGLTLETWFQISIEKTFPSPADLETLLGHPGLSESIGRHNGHALYSLLGVVTRFGPDELYTPHADGIARVLGECGRTTDVGVVLKAAEAYAGVVSRAARSGPEWAQTRVLRDAVLAAMESAQAGAPEVDAALLRDAGAFVRLIGGEAPELNFVWTSEDLGSEAAPEAEPSAGTAPGESAGATTLSGLRGRLVILDFWATWCKPCIAAFPKMDALRERYKDAPVTILGVTSAQGYHMRGTERVSTRREDGTVDEAREHELMKEFIAAHPSLTWPVVFTRQRVFNDDYFVTGIPHLTIIAPDGSVRANTLRPGMPAEDLHRMIDGILAEFGLAMPG